MPRSQAPAHWSKDFVEHLRTVHFTLVALCVGLIVLASFPSKTEIQIAHQQVLQILEVTNTWQEDLFETRVTQMIKEAVSGNDQNDLVSHSNADGSLGFSISVKEFVDYSPRLRGEPWKLKIEVPLEFIHDNLRVKVPGSLKSFQRLWDALLSNGDLSIPTRPKGCTAFDHVIDQKTYKETSKERSNCAIQSVPSNDKNLKPLEMELLHQGDRPVDIEGLGPYGFGFVGWDSSPRDPTFLTKKPSNDELIDVRIVVAASQLRHIEFDGHGVLVARSEKWKEKSRLQFKDAFRELAAVYEPFEDSTILSAERIVDAEEKRSGDAFEAAGLKIPAEVAVRCGVLLVLGVQLYLLIHLREFGNRLDREAGFEVAWIGVYSSRLARVMLLISLLLLPACTVVLLSIRGLSMTEHKRIAWAALVASNVASLTLAYFIFRVLPEPPAAVPASPAAEQSKTEPSASSASPSEQKLE